MASTSTLRVHGFEPVFGHSPSARDLVPDAGHLIHMPTHLGVLCGHYRDVLVSR